MLLPLALVGALARPFITTKQLGQQAWFITPQGDRLWSFAVDCVDTGKAGTPDNPSYFAKRLYPNDSAWAQATVDRLRNWGFNSLGGWCDTDLLERTRRPLPYIEVLHLGAYDKAPWNDLFAPEAERLMGEAAHKLIPPHRKDPNLIGYCTDNELGWWDDTLFLSYFKFAAQAPGKRALIASLHRTYNGSFPSFQRDWITRATTFEALAKETSITLRPGTRGIRAVHAFNYDLASHYYKLVKHLVRREDRQHLILGDRYCQYYNLETARASRGFIDVTSTNGGADWLDGTYTHFMLDTLHRITQKPVLITEFYFAARENQSGSKNSGEIFPTVQTQAERDAGFARCVNDLASRPYLVGAHWFQFYDEPPKGRGDGENFNMGFLDVYGKPYVGMIQAAQHAKPSAVHARVTPGVTPCITPAPTHPLDNNLTDWDRQRGYIPCKTSDQWADLYACSDVRNLYVGLIAMEFIDSSLWPQGKMAEVDRPKLTLRINGYPVSVSFNGDAKRKAVCSSKGVTLAERHGLKHTLILQIPAALLHRKALRPGNKLNLDAVLTSHGHGYEMKWHQSLILK